MNPKNKYMVATIVILGYFLVYLGFASFVYFNTTSFVFGLIFPFDWAIFLGLLAWSFTFKNKWDFFTKKYSNSIEVFDWTNKTFRGETILLAIANNELILYKPRLQKEEKTNLSTVKKIDLQDFGIFQGGNPGFKKLKLKTDLGEFILSVHKNDINYILEKIGGN